MMFRFFKKTRWFEAYFEMQDIVSRFVVIDGTPYHLAKDICTYSTLTADEDGDYRRSFTQASNACQQSMPASFTLLLCGLWAS